MMSGLVGAGIGALGGAAFGTNGVNGFLGSWGPGVGIGLLVAGGAYSAATGNLDTFAGGLIGGIGGYVAGQGALNSNVLKNNPSVKAYKQTLEQKNNQALKSDNKPEVQPGSQGGKKLVPNYDVEGKIKSYDLVDDNMTVYRQGTFADDSGWPGNSIHGGEWAPENPLTTSGFAKKYGLPFENTGNPDWVIKGQLRGEYGLGPAPASYNYPANIGGAIEIRPYNPNDVKLDYFHMP
jgi:hypothetical protein